MITLKCTKFKIKICRSIYHGNHSNIQYTWWIPHNICSADFVVKSLFHHSGYDFGYLLKLLTANELPAHDEGYFELLNLYFPQVYDVKVIMKSCGNLRGGLQEVADSLEVFFELFHN